MRSPPRSARKSTEGAAASAFVSWLAFDLTIASATKEASAKLGAHDRNATIWIVRAGPAARSPLRRSERRIGAVRAVLAGSAA